MTGVHTLSILLTLLSITALLISNSPSTLAGGVQNMNADWIGLRSGCDGSIGECLGDDGELEMDTESHRRILATTRYISYGAMQRNTVPCSRRGASYYNCRPGAQANPYSRGCSQITRCRR